MSDQSPSLPDLRVPAPQLEPDDAFVAQLASLAAASSAAPPHSTASSWRIGLAAAAVAAVLGGGAWLSSALTGTDAPAPPTSPATRPAVTPAPPASPTPSGRSGRTEAGQVRSSDHADARPGDDTAPGGRSGTGTQPSAPHSSAPTEADGQTGPAPGTTAPGATDGQGPGQSGHPHGQHTPDADPPGHGSEGDHGQESGNDQGDGDRGSDDDRDTDDHDSDAERRGTEDQPAGG